MDNSLKQFQKEDVKVMDSLPRFGIGEGIWIVLHNTMCMCSPALAYHTPESIPASDGPFESKIHPSKFRSTDYPKWI